MVDKGVKATPRSKEYIFPVLLGGAFVLFLLLRLRTLNAIPNHDEARFILFVRAFASGDPNGTFYWGINYHPPLYLSLCRLGMGIWGESLTLYRLISLAFAAGSFFILYRLAREVSGRTVALFACLALALLPAASSTDVWVKEDPACIFWMLCALLFFVRRRYAWSGIFLGLGLLSKENAGLLLLVLPVYLLLVREKKDVWRGLVLTTVIAGLVSGWWYLFLSNSTGDWRGFFLGSSAMARQWYHPWHYYLSSTVVDLGWPLLFLAVWGGVRAVKACLKGGDRGVILPVVWVVVCYLVLSISSGKPFWMITLTLPAWAWLAGSGLKGMYDFFAVRGRALAAFALLAALVAALGVNFHQGGDRYFPMRSPSYYQLSTTSREIAETFNRELPENSALLIYMPLTNPIILYELRSDIEYVIVPPEIVDSEHVGELRVLWSAEGVSAAYLFPDERGEWLAQVYHYYLGGELVRNPNGLFLLPER